jgi:hypothetical protein
MVFIYISNYEIIIIFQLLHMASLLTTITNKIKENGKHSQIE